MAAAPLHLHIGEPKSGTTFLQAVLWRHRERLRAAGLLVPGDAPQSHFWASLDVRDVRRPGFPAERVDGAWQRLVTQARDWDGPVVVDHESFSTCSPAQIARVLGDLSFAEVHVVVTARDLARQLPASWQERMKNRETVTFGDFVSRVCASGALDAMGRNFWHQHDVAALVSRWARAAPGRLRVHVVTVPHPGADRDELWRRFAGVLGLDPAAWDTEVDRANSSLSAAGSEVLRRFNTEIADLDVPWLAYARTVKHEVAPALAALGGTPIGLPRQVHDQLTERARSVVARLRETDVEVVGDLDDLVPAAWCAGADPDHPDPDEFARAAVVAMAEMFRFQRERDLERRQQQAAEAQRPPRPVAELRRWVGRRARPGGDEG